MKFSVSFRHCYGHIDDIPGDGRQSLLFSTDPNGSLGTRNHSFAHHHTFDIPPGHHWYMSTPKDSNPGTSDHESQTLCVAPRHRVRTGWNMHGKNYLQWPLCTNDLIIAKINVKRWKCYPYLLYTLSTVNHRGVSEC